MKILVFFTLLCAYILCGLLGFSPKGYVDSNGVEKFIEVHRTELSVFVILFSLLMTFLFWNAFRGLMRKKKELIVCTIGFAIGFCFLSFGYEKTQLRFLNKTKAVSTVRINGNIENTYWKWKRRRGNRRPTSKRYYVKIRDSVSGRLYVFMISDYIYNRTKAGDTIDKVFSIGRLGILYRKETE